MGSLPDLFFVPTRLVGLLPVSLILNALVWLLPGWIYCLISFFLVWFPSLGLHLSTSWCQFFDLAFLLASSIFCSWYLQVIRAHYHRFRMAKMAGVSRRPSLLLFLACTAFVKTSDAFHSFDLLPRSVDSCPSSYSSCGNDLPSDFCCSTSSTCISLDNATSAICCPTGSTCDYISPIVCDVQSQNATLYPRGTVKTTRLHEDLPKCGDACCPFGYTCHGGNTCVMDKKSSNTAASPSSSASAAANGATVTPVSSPSPTASKDGAAGSAINSSSFPSKAVAAGFFPGAIFGAVLALLISTCVRRRKHKKQQRISDPKAGAYWSQHSSRGGIKGISSPIPSEDTSYRSDFLLRPFILRPPAATARNSTGARSTRSMMHRTGTRVRSLFSGANGPRAENDIPPLPTRPDPVTPPRQREPSTESIKVYSPPGAFAQSRKFLGPEPYPGTIARPDTTFTDLVKAVGFNDSKGNPSFKVTPARD